MTSNGIMCVCVCIGFAADEEFKCTYFRRFFYCHVIEVKFVMNVNSVMHNSCAIISNS